MKDKSKIPLWVIASLSIALVLLLGASLLALTY